MSDEVVVGDLNSDAVGSGARKNGGKADYSLLPISLLLSAINKTNYPRLDSVDYVTGAFEALSEWQSSGKVASLQQALCEVVLASRLIPRDLHEYNQRLPFHGAAKVFAFGKGKYNAWNWAKGMPWSVPFACAIRHLLAATEHGSWAEDSESNLPHLWHVQCNIIMLLTYASKPGYAHLNDMPFAVLSEECRLPTCVEDK